MLIYVSDGVVLDMVVATASSPPRHILCRRENESSVVCVIKDKAMNIEVTRFRVSNDLVYQIPQLLSLYIK